MGGWRRVAFSLVVSVLVALLPMTGAQGSEWMTVPAAFGEGATCESLPFAPRVACISCEVRADTSRTPLLLSFLVLMSANRIEATQCREWHFERPPPDSTTPDRTAPRPKWFVRKEPDIRCALMDVAPGSTCKDGVVSRLTEGLAESRPHRSDVCDRVEAAPNAICVNGTIIDPSPKQEREAFFADPCIYMEVPRGASCLNGIVTDDTPIDPLGLQTYDRCAYLDYGSKGSCIDGVLKQNSSETRPSSTNLRDDWEEREQLIAQREEILKALEQNRVQKALLPWREAGVHVYFALSYAAARSFTMATMVASAANPFKTWKSSKKLIDGAFNVGDKIEKNIERFEHERDENNRREAQLLADKKKAEDEIKANEEKARSEKEEEERGEKARQAEQDRQDRERSRRERDRDLEKARQEQRDISRPPAVDVVPNKPSEPAPVERPKPTPEPSIKLRNS